MSNPPPEDRSRGPYTPSGNDELPFERGGFDPRSPYGNRAGGYAPQRPLPMTLIASAAVLLVLIVAVVLFYRAGVRGADQAPAAVGQPVAATKGEAPVEAQPVDPNAGMNVYVEGGQRPVEAAQPTLAPPPETPQPRPEPLLPRGAAPASTANPAPTPANPPAAVPRPAATTPTVPAPKPATPQVPAPTVTTPTVSSGGRGGGSAVQIGAFGSPAIADREYAAVAAAFPQFARGRVKRVEQVTASNGSTVYRTTFNGLSSEDARAFCGALRASGRDCLVR